MASSLPLEIQKQWFDIRDHFLGDMNRPQNMKLALEQASSCEHPDACWLASVCRGKSLDDLSTVREVFLANGDPRALAFAWQLGDEEQKQDLTLLRKASELGDPYGLACLAGETSEEESFAYAQMSASKGERDGLYYLGCCYFNCEGERKWSKLHELLRC